MDSFGRAVTSEAAVSGTTTNYHVKGVIVWWVSVYLVFVAGFAGWCGKEFWSWQNVLLVVLPPSVVALASAIHTWWRYPTVMIVDLVKCVASLVAGAAIGGMGLSLAWSIAAKFGGWPNAYARSATFTILMALLMLLVWLSNRSKKSRADQRGRYAKSDAPE
jgi:hypothetical protein